jgi:hypothetical protein
MGNLVFVLNRQASTLGKYTEAQAINCQTLELSEEVLCKTNPSTLATISNIALVLDKYRACQL